MEKTKEFQPLLESNLYHKHEKKNKWKKKN